MNYINSHTILVKGKFVKEEIIVISLYFVLSLQTIDPLPFVGGGLFWREYIIVICLYFVVVFLCLKFFFLWT